MKRKGNRHRLKQIHQEYKTANWVIFFVGLLLFIVGLIKLIFFHPEIAVNARYLQPTIDNGGLMAIAGLVLLCCGVYRIRNKEKVIKDTFDLENDS